MATLALVSVALLVFESVQDLTETQLRLIDYVEMSIAVVFLVEFAVRMYFATARGKFLRRNWWLLLASIPIAAHWAEALRALRLLRAVRVVRVLVDGEHIWENR